MPDTVETAALAAAAVVIGAVVSAMAASYAARQKITELRLTYAQKLRIDYLTNARSYTSSLYVPLSVNLSRLSEDYRSFRNHIDFENGTAWPEAERKFRNDCAAYLTAVDAQFRRGASAFLTTELEERLLAFNAFLAESVAVAESVTKLVVEYGVDLRVLPFGRQALSFSRQVRLPATQTRFFPRGLVSASLGVIGIGYHGSTVLAAPIASRDFEGRVLRDLTELKALIKEVTLGAHAGA